MAKILIVDDHPVNRQFLAKLLGYVNHTVYEAADGVEALATMQTVRPDLIITDIVMPRMDGVTFAKELAARPALADIPVIFYTASHRVPDAQTMAKQCGVVHVLHKPVRPADILKAVSDLLGSAEPAGQRDQLGVDIEHLRLAALTELGFELTKETDPARVLDKVCQALRYITGAALAGILVVDSDGQPSRHFVRSSPDEDEPFAAGPGLTATALTALLGNRGSVRLANPEVFPEHLGIWPDQSIPSFLGATIPLPGQPLVAALYAIGKPGAGEFTRDDEKLAVTLAAQAAVAYENALLHAVLQNRARELEREVAERQRAESERDRFFTQSLNLLFVAGFDGYFKRLNPAWETALGYSLMELLAEPFLKFVHPDDRAAVTTAIGKLSMGQHIPSFECRSVCKDGSYRWFLWNGTPSLDQAEIYGTGHDITLRKQAEAERKRSEETNALLAAIVGSAEDAIFSKTLDGTITSWNAGAERLFGYRPEEIIGQSIRRLIPPDRQDEEDRIVDCLRRGEPVKGFETVRRHKEGRPIDVSLTISPVKDVAGAIIGASKIVRDITERKKLEEQYRQAQKMEAIGQLAGGVAHDFNNLLTIINGYGQLLSERFPPGDPTRELLGQVVAAGDRAAGLTRQLLAFSRKAIIEPKILNLKTVVADVDKLLCRILGEDIQLAVVADPEPWAVKADPGQIEQVLMNLVVNARDAMPRGGCLTIEVRNVELDATYARDHVEVKAGPHVLLAVSDTGCGMDRTTLARIFEPFFSTKGERGTGLGLATVHGIVKQSGGHVAVYSEVGHGTTFKVYLPRVQQQRPHSGKSHPGLAATAPGSETVLVVEDEDGVRALTRYVLQVCGYTVLVARDGAEALRVAGQQGVRIDLLVTDVVMPRMSGRELAECLVGKQLGLKVLFVSGFTDDAVVRHGILEAEVAFLQKPFSPASLAAKVREVLDDR